MQALQAGVERRHRLILEGQHQRLLRRAHRAGDALQRVHRLVLARRLQGAQRAVGRGAGPDIEEARGQAVAGSLQRRVQPLRIERAHDADRGLVAAAPRQADRAPGVEEGPAPALVAPALAPQPGQPGGGLVAPQQHALPPLGHGLLQRRQRGIGDHHRRPPPSRASTRSTVPSGRRSHSSAGVLPLRRAADQRLPQDHGLAPGLGDARRHALAAQARDGRQQGLRDVVLRRARPLRGVLHPLPPLGGEDLQGKDGQLGTALLQKAGIDRGPGRRRRLGRPPGVALRPGVAEDGRAGW